MEQSVDTHSKNSNNHHFADLKNITSSKYQSLHPNILKTAALLKLNIIQIGKL